MPSIPTLGLGPQFGNRPTAPPGSRSPHPGRFSGTAFVILFTNARGRLHPSGAIGDCGGGSVALTWTRSTEWDSDDWREVAACRDTDPDLFFPIGTTGQAIEQIEAARRSASNARHVTPASSSPLPPTRSPASGAQPRKTSAASSARRGWLSAPAGLLKLRPPPGLGRGGTDTYPRGGPSHRPALHLTARPRHSLP